MRPSPKEPRKLTRGQMVIAVVGGGCLAFALGVGVAHLTHKPPQVTVVKANTDTTLRPVKPQGPVIVLEEGADKGKSGKFTKAVKVAARPRPVEKIVGVGPERKLPTKGEKRHLTMYANLQTVAPTLYRIDVADQHKGVEPGKGYFKLKKLGETNRERPFVDTEGAWVSTKPPIYLMWPRDKTTPLPTQFAAVYIKAGIYYPVDLTRAFLNGRDDVVVKKIPGDKDNFYVSLPQGKR